jgi:sugar O-acyltransferase (sialic acid O-acetyltransferase NeuD family)
MTQPDRGPVVVVGAGDHGRVVLDVLRAAGDDAIGFVEPGRAAGAPERVIDGLRVIGDLAGDTNWATAGTRFVVALGDNSARRDAFERCLQLGLSPAMAIHPAATLLAGARVESGTLVCAGAVIGVTAWVGPNVIVNTLASIDHDDRIGAHANVSPGAHLAGRVTIGEGAYIGIGASVREGLRIGDWALVAGGAMVIDHVPSGARVAGVPARPMAERPR